MFEESWVEKRVKEKREKERKRESEKKREREERREKFGVRFFDLKRLASCLLSLSNV